MEPADKCCLISDVLVKYRDSIGTRDFINVQAVNGLLVFIQRGGDPN